MADLPLPPDIDKNVDRGWRIWNIKEIYVPGGDGRIVPNANDLIQDYDNGFLRVISVDYTTGISVRQPWTVPQPGGNVDEDVIVGSGPGYTTESFRVLLNTNTMPFTLTCDSRLRVFGTESQYIKIFRGTDISAVTGKVISMYYDQSGQFLGENIPLEINRQPDAQNVAQKNPKTGYTSYRIDDGEIVTVVAYGAQGQVTDVSRCVIMNSSFARRASDSMKYVREIALESTWLSPSDEQVIQVPINAPVTNLNLIGRVTYSNGDVRRLPVDGTKFSMDGINEYTAMVEGQRHPLVLHYKLAEDEQSYITNPSFANSIDKDYYAVTVAFNGSVGVKLYCVPVWQDTLTGYRLEWYMYNLVRSQWWNVTNYVEPATGSAVYDPTRYGVSQRLSFALNLKRVDPRFADWRHVQTLSVQLKAPGNEQNTENWAILYTPDQNPPSGFETKALAHLINVNNWEVDIRCGAATLEEWLKKVYYAQQPLMDDRSEEKAPEPNFMLIRSAQYEVELPISQWNQTLQMLNVPQQGQAIYIHFMRRNASTDLQLAVAGLITHRS